MFCPTYNEGVWGSFCSTCPQFYFRSFNAENSYATVIAQTAVTEESLPAKCPEGRRTKTASRFVKWVELLVAAGASWGRRQVALDSRVISMCKISSFLLLGAGTVIKSNYINTNVTPAKISLIFF